MPDEQLDELGQLVRGARKRKLLTQAQLSEATRIAQSDLSAIEKGHKVDMLASSINRIAAALDLDPAALLRGFAKRKAAATLSVAHSASEDSETVPLDNGPTLTPVEDEPTPAPVG